MKLQGLAIIFIIIILPISMVLSTYVGNKINTSMTELDYNTKLLNSTYDSIKAYQLNTINNSFGDITNSKISDIEAAISTFYNSLANNFTLSGYKSENVMQEYVPAVAFTLYDGYYIYSPFFNRLEGVDITTDDGDPVDYDPKYSSPNQITNGLKPYVYYSVRYKNTVKNWDFVITYTLDNYITIMGQIGLNGSDPNYVYDSGYLYPISKINDGTGIYHNTETDSYFFEGIEFNPSDTEELKEYVGGIEYPYAKINGKKYYLEEKNEGNSFVKNGVRIYTNSKIFYIDSNGTKNYNQVNLYNDTKPQDYKDNSEFIKYYLAIKKNKSAYMYFKNAYEFSNMVFGDIPISEYKDKANQTQDRYGLEHLETTDAEYYDKDNNKTNELKQSGITPLSEYGSFEIFRGDEDVHLAGSNFNKHRKAIIRYVIETNMSTAISGFKSNAVDEFIMPKISDTDWETIQNDICEISFLQGLNMGLRKYNGYSVVANMLTKDYIDEDDIYFLTTDNTYCKTNDETLNRPNVIPSKDGLGGLGYYPGIWKINFERKKFLNEGENENDDTQEEFYYPLQIKGTGGTSYLGSYTSIMGSSNITEIGTNEYPDMYTYVNKLNNPTIKSIYYKALARERWGSFNVNNINYEIYGNNSNEYFLKDYKW